MKIAARTAILAIAALLTASMHGARAAAADVAVADFDYADTSGEMQDQRAAHEQRLQNLSATIVAALEKSGRFKAERLTCPKPPCSADNMDQDEIVKAARAQHAQFVVFGGVHKMSTLIQWGQIEVMDTATGQPRLSRTVTFRGDSEDAWTHAADYVGQMVTSALAH